MNSKRIKKTGSRLIRTIAYAMLILAFIYGKFFRPSEYTTEQLAGLIQAELVEDGQTGKNYVFTDKGSDTGERLLIGEAQGYGGPLCVAILVDISGFIKEVLIVDERETFAFIEKLYINNFFKRFIGKKINDPLEVGEDIDAVSGCTISSVGFSQAVQEASYKKAIKDGLSVHENIVSWKIGLEEFFVLLCIVLGIVSFYLKKKTIRYISLACGFIVIGFYVNASLSLSHFGRLFLGFLPAIQTNLIWWLLAIVSIGFALFMRKNIYCHSICPFHAAQIVLMKISGIKLSLTKKVQQVAKHTSSFLLWMALMIIFIGNNPSAGSYEPFAMLFSLEGAGIQWYMLPAALIGAMLVPDFYCRYFCPVGRALNSLCKLGKYFKPQKRVL